MPRADAAPGDALHDLASDEAGEDEQSSRPEEQAAVEVGADPVLMQQPPIAQSGAPRAVPPVSGDTGPSRGKKKATPVILLIAGLVFLLPALWGVLFLAGATDLWADRDNARGVALAALLIGSAFALAMFAAAAYFNWMGGKRR